MATLRRKAERLAASAGKVRSISTLCDILMNSLCNFTHLHTS